MIRSRRVAFVVVLLVMFTLSGCVFGEAGTPTPLPPRSIVACDEETFGEFYEKLGGLNGLGPCISPMFVKNDFAYQYTQNGLMIYDSSAPVVQQYRLGKIGYNINLDLTSMPEHGYDVWEDVEPLYTETGGVFGLALTEVLRDGANQRYIQYFEGAAFYRYYADAPGTIRWLPYGEWFCGEQCQQYASRVTPESDDIHDAMLTPTPPIRLGDDEITQTLADYAERLGETFTGKPLSSVAIPIGDGWYELAYENVVLALDPDNFNIITLRPLPKLLGYAIEPGVNCVHREGYICVPLEDDLVHMVPAVFYDFLVQHGSMEIAGAPTTIVHPGKGSTSYQCFESLCLQFDDNAPEGQRVSVMPLGSDYFRRDTTPIATPDVLASKLVIQTWPAYGLMPNGQAQEIYVQAIEGTKPVAGVLFSLSLTYPDGTIFEQNFPLTDANGQAFLTLDPITAPDATNVPYVVCYLGLQDDQSVCINGVFTIWSSAP